MCVDGVEMQFCGPITGQMRARRSNLWFGLLPGCDLEQVTSLPRGCLGTFKTFSGSAFSTLTTVICLSFPPGCYLLPLAILEQGAACVRIAAKLHYRLGVPTL